jgi:hypothetical protein
MRCSNFSKKKWSGSFIANSSRQKIVGAPESKQNRRREGLSIFSVNREMGSKDSAAGAEPVVNWR